MAPHVSRCRVRTEVLCYLTCSKVQACHRSCDMVGDTVQALSPSHVAKTMRCSLHMPKLMADAIGPGKLCAKAAAPPQVQAGTHMPPCALCSSGNSHCFVSDDLCQKYSRCLVSDHSANQPCTIRIDTVKARGHENRKPLRNRGNGMADQWRGSMTYLGQSAAVSRFCAIMALHLGSLIFGRRASRSTFWRNSTGVVEVLGGRWLRRNRQSPGRCS